MFNMETLAKIATSKVSKSKFTLHLLSSTDEITLEKVKQFKWRESRVLSIALATFDQYYTVLLKKLSIPDHHALVITTQLKEALVKLMEWNNYTSNEGNYAELIMEEMFRTLEAPIAPRLLLDKITPHVKFDVETPIKWKERKISIVNTDENAKLYVKSNNNQNASTSNSKKQTWKKNKSKSKPKMFKYVPKAKCHFCKSANKICNNPYHKNN